MLTRDIFKLRMEPAANTNLLSLTDRRKPFSLHFKINITKHFTAKIAEHEKIQSKYASMIQIINVK